MLKGVGRAGLNCAAESKVIGRITRQCGSIASAYMGGVGCHFDLDFKSIEYLAAERDSL